MREALDGLDVRYLVRGVADSDVAELDSGLAAQSDELDPAPTHRDDMAFWLYSSGSTGKPKGVVHLHHDIEVTCETFARQVLGLREDDVVFSTTKLFHAYGLGNSLSFTAVVRRDGGAHDRPDAPRADPRQAARAPPDGVLLGPGALQRAGARGRRRRRAGLACACASRPPRRCRRTPSTAGRSASAWRSSTASARPRCCTSSAPTGRAPSGAARPARRCRATSCASPTRRAASSRGPAVGNLEVRGDSCAAFYWHQHEKTKACMRGDWFTTGDRYERREDGAYVVRRAAPTRCSRSAACGSPRSTWSTCSSTTRGCRPPASSASCSTTPAASRPSSSAAADGTPDDELAEELRAMCKERLRRYEYPHVVRVRRRAAAHRQRQGAALQAAHAGRGGSER